MSYGFKIMVEGDYACFTRPEFKVERVSYDIPTPSAVVGMLKSVYWKPAIRYVVDKIIVFNPIKFDNIRRNEVKDKIVKEKIKKQMQGEKSDPSIYTSNPINQRTTMLLKNVCYGIEFHFELTGLKSEKETNPEDKHYNIILERLRNGRSFRQPCLGCREFSVKRLELVDEFDLSKVSQDLKGTRDLGFMLYDMVFEDKGRPINDNWDNPVFRDEANAIYYRPIMIDGVVDVQKYRKRVIS